MEGTMSLKGAMVEPGNVAHWLEDLGLKCNCEVSLGPDNNISAEFYGPGEKFCGRLRFFTGIDEAAAMWADDESRMANAFDGKRGEVTERLMRYAREYAAKSGGE